MNKKIALISTFCDNEEKKEVLRKNISLIKENGIDVLIISPFSLPEDIISSCSYFFLTKDNPLLDWPVKAYCWWLKVSHKGKTYKMSKTFPDYGFAGLTQVKQLSEIALMLEYDQFFHMIYDTKIDEVVIDGFHSDRNNSIYPSRRGDDIWPVGLHYMIFDRENLQKFSSYITMERYLSLIDNDAFGLLHHAVNEFNFTIEKNSVEDWIFFYKDKDVFNCSDIPGLDFFIERDPISMSTVKIFFYKNEDPIKIKLDIEGDIKEIEVDKCQIIDLGFDSENTPNHIFLEYNSQKYDIKKLIEGVKNSTLEIEE